MVKAKKKTKKKPLPSLKKLRDTLWELTSLYVRLSRTDSNGYCACVTCGAVKPYQEMQAGHFVPKARGNAVKFDLRNVAPQCYRCNINLGSNPSAYAVWMLDTYGEAVIRELEQRAHGVTIFRRADYDRMIADITEKLAGLSARTTKEMMI